MTDRPQVDILFSTHWGSKFGVYETCLVEMWGLPAEWGLWLMWLCVAQVYIVMEDVGCIEEVSE